ncbi:MAG: nucleotidyltransferase family protein [Hyphomonadaceae bacterium]
MSVPLNRVVVMLLASGLSRRYGRRDKLMALLGHKPLIDHSADVIASLPVLARVAVCPPDHHSIRNSLAGRFVIALNKKPKHGLGHSIAVGVQVALQFKPDAIVVCMGDMAFIEPWLIEALTAKLGDVDIVHAGAPGRVHPPTAFGAASFEQLSQLEGDDGAKKIIGQGGFRVLGLNAPPPILLDVDTREELDFARRQLAVRARYPQQQITPERPTPCTTSSKPLAAAAEQVPPTPRRANARPS